MKNILRIIAVLIGLSPIQSYGMERPIIKRSNAIEATAGAKSFIKQVLRDYELDPNSYKILAYCDPNDGALAVANSGTNTIYLNDGRDSFDSLSHINTSEDIDINSRHLEENALKIYYSYHEAGHIKDHASQKIILAAKGAGITTLLAGAALGYFSQKLLSSAFPNCWLFQSKSILGTTWFNCSLLTSTILGIMAKDYADIKATHAAEIRADTLACEQLLKKQWGLLPITAYLGRLIVNAQDKDQGKDADHDAIAEYNNIVQLLKSKRGYTVQNIVSTDTITLKIMHNNIRKLSVELGVGKK